MFLAVMFILFVIGFAFALAAFLWSMLGLRKSSYKDVQTISYVVDAVSGLSMVMILVRVILMFMGK
jgi:uncharacterized membrane protein